MEQTIERRSKRYLGNVKIFCCETIGNILNLSQHGVGFRVEKNYDRFVKGQTYDLYLHLQENEEFPDGESLGLTGIIRFRQYDEQTKCLKVGIEFIPKPGDQQISLGRFVNFLEETNQFWGF